MLNDSNIIVNKINYILKWDLSKTEKSHTIVEKK